MQLYISFKSYNCNYIPRVFKIIGAKVIILLAEGTFIYAQRYLKARLTVSFISLRVR